MKSLSYSELRNYSQWIQNEMSGAQLQDVWTNGQTLVLQFYRYEDKFFVIESGQFPWVAIGSSRPAISKKQKPVALFLHAHGKNLRWDRIWTDQSAGRVLFLSLEGGDRHCEVEIQLIPKHFNFIVRASEKVIAWDKPRELPPSQVEEQPIEVRDWARWSDQMLSSRKAEKSKVVSRTEGSLLKTLEKKRGALEKLKEGLGESEAERWQALGELLKMGRAPGDEWSDLYNEKMSIAENRERAFQKSKDSRRKRQGTLNRQNILEGEIAELTKRIQSGELVEVARAPSVAQKVLRKTESKARKKVFGSQFEAVLGKSGADNLAILRQARAWDYWFHLKDYPGAHAILFRQRDQDVPRNVLQEIAEWVMEESLSASQVKMISRYDVVIVECRFVRPIKGDKLGRVTYHHPQVFSFASKS